MHQMECEYEDVENEKSSLPKPQTIPKPKPRAHGPRPPVYENWEVETKSPTLPPRKPISESSQSNDDEHQDKDDNISGRHNSHCSNQDDSETDEPPPIPARPADLQFPHHLITEPEPVIDENMKDIQITVDVNGVVHDCPRLVDDLNPLGMESCLPLRVRSHDYSYITTFHKDDLERTKGGCIMTVEQSSTRTDHIKIKFFASSQEQTAKSLEKLMALHDKMHKMLQLQNIDMKKLGSDTKALYELSKAFKMILIEREIGQYQFLCDSDLLQDIRLWIDKYLERKKARAECDRRLHTVNNLAVKAHSGYLSPEPTKSTTGNIPQSDGLEYEDVGDEIQKKSDHQETPSSHDASMGYEYEYIGVDYLRRSQVSVGSYLEPIPPNQGAVAPDNSFVYEDPDLAFGAPTASKTADISRQPKLSGSKLEGAEHFRRCFLINKLCQFHIHVCDITQLSVDVIVSPTSERLEHSKGVAKSIATAAGEQLLTSCRQYINRRGMITLTQVASTNSGRLPCKSVYNIVSPPWPKANEKSIAKKAKEAKEKIGKTFNNILQHLYEDGYRSIAMPLIHSGSSGTPIQVIANVLTDSLISFKPKKSVEDRLVEVHLVDKKQDVLELVADQIEIQFQRSPKVTFLQCQGCH